MATKGIRNRSLLDEIEAFDAQFQELREKYQGKWVVLCEGNVVGDFERFDDADVFAKNELGDRTYLIEIADTRAYLPSASV